MASPPVGFGEAVFLLQSTGQPRLSSWTLGISETLPTARTPEDVAQLLYFDFSTTNCPYAATAMIGNWSFVGVNYTRQTESGPLVGEYRQTTTGGAVGLGMTPNVAILVKKVTGAGGRRNRGRMYIPPVYPGEAGVDYNGVIDADKVLVLQSQYAVAYSLIVDDDLLPVLFHTEAPFTPTDISSFQVQQIVATQRRRLRR